MTLVPASAKRLAAARPATPAPTTTTSTCSLVAFTFRSWRSSGVEYRRRHGRRVREARTEDRQCPAHSPACVEIRPRTSAHGAQNVAEIAEIDAVDGPLLLTPRFTFPEDSHRQHEGVESVEHLTVEERDSVWAHDPAEFRRESLELSRGGRVVLDVAGRVE